jgi:hypothetical protein
VAGQPGDRVADHVHFADGDGGVGGDPAFDSQSGAPLRAREARASSRVSSW